MQANPTWKAFPLPVVSVGPGSQPVEDETLDYISMPQGMATWRPPVLPEPEELAGHAGAVRVLHQALAALQAAARGEPVAPVPVTGLDEADLALLHQVLGEGEVSARVAAAPVGAGEREGRDLVVVQESVFAGLWRVVRAVDGEGPRDWLEVGAVPEVLRAAARDDGRRQPLPALSALPPAPPEVQNAPLLLAEVIDHAMRWQPGRSTQVINLTLLPVTPLDIGWLDMQLGDGRVQILSRGYGNCRITSTATAMTWRVVYYNSQDTVILNTVEVGALPEVACAAIEDLQDSVERLGEVLAWVERH